MAIVYQYDAAGYYVGPVDDYGAAALPHNAIRSVPPPDREGHIQRWNGHAWERVENYKGREGYLNGQPHKITEYGPLPEGFRDTPPEPTKAELAEKRRQAIQTEFFKIREQTERPQRALEVARLLGRPLPEEDKTRLIALEARAEELRAELAALEVQNG